jgi:uncharacterized protein (TIGR02646 family)
MIYVDRNSVTKPDILVSRGAKETANAITFFSNPLNSKNTFEFKVYADPQVKDALIQLFRSKCAYCESTFRHVYSGDIEHFRPKGEIEEADPDTRPGYYWLAADWDNLLLSCRNCNQKLKHLIYGTIDKKTMGKMNQFPLSNRNKYTRTHNSHNGINDEEPYRLLLNPCIDNPEDHLEYGLEGTIRAKRQNDGTISLKGSSSIDVYVLQRMPLVQAREKVAIDIQAQIQRVKEATLNYNDYLLAGESSKKIYFEKILRRELMRLRRFLSPDEPYIGMARQLIGEFLKVNFNIIIS